MTSLPASACPYSRPPAAAPSRDTEQHHVRAPIAVATSGPAPAVLRDLVGLGCGYRSDVVPGARGGPPTVPPMWPVPTTPMFS